MVKKLPKISVITPSYNQAKFIEQTINSVLNQNYPYLEYTVMDGGSTDGTVKVLKKYGKKIIWFSEKDKGQSHAINKGLKKSKGEIIGFLNSDDYLEPGSLFKVGEFFSENKKTYWLTGKCKIVDEKSREVRKFATIYKNLFLKYLRNETTNKIVQFISQPATFWRREVMETIGYFDESLHYDMDYDYWLRMWRRYKLYFLDEYLALYRVHSASKAVVSPETQFQIEYDIVRRYTSSKLVLTLHKMHSNLALSFYKAFWIKQKLLQNPHLSFQRKLESIWIPHKVRDDG